MDRLWERSHGESIKSTILKHEVIFKQQVGELHRLYKVQKLLMTNLLCENKKKMSPVEEKEKKEEAINKLSSSRTSSETTLTSPTNTKKTSKKIDGQNPIEGESSKSCSNEDCNLNLTLSIGCASYEMKGADWKGSAQLLSSKLRRDDNGANSFNKSHWLFNETPFNRT